MIKFPARLETLLNISPLQPAVRAYANSVSIILADNKLPFFPDYTDHGVEHINQVLESEVDLIPKAVWNELVLCDKDAAVLIGATLLHDFAMHLQQDGFLELVSENSRFKPLPWFRDKQEGHAADRPWFDLWLDFEREARRFSDRNLGQIIGLESVREGWKFEHLPKNSGEWQHNHCLIIGEFIRRHHARLAHEIAIYGFPGLEAGHGASQFPALGASDGHLQPLADLIGLTARSHGMNLRVCLDYLDSNPAYKDDPKPMGSAVLYPMALLRVADYLQIDQQRAPTVLLKLRNPQSPVSVMEWSKHRAVLHIGSHKNLFGKKVVVSENLSQAVYLQLRDLLADLQKEMDHATAVLDEAYGTRADLKLHHLSLATRRVYCNLNDPNFLDSLPYIPERTSFSADPNLLTLLVEPLYGKEPGVGVRELMQNAVDAVCELHAWCKAHDKAVESLDLPKQDSDVQIDFIQRKDATWFLRVTDKGIGMSSATLQNYFLRAGASFRQSPEWAKEFLDDDGKPRVLRAGRFGIGAFAVFLLGPKFRLWTRHVGAKDGEGYEVEASFDSELIEIRRKNGLDVGTTIEVDISRGSAIELKLDNMEDCSWTRLADKTDWFCWSWPIVSRRVIRCGSTEALTQKYTAPLKLGKPTLLPEWSVIYPGDFDAVYWTYRGYPAVSCNGIIIDNLHSLDRDSIFHADDVNYFDCEDEETQLRQPIIAVCDSDAKLPLTVQRNYLSYNNLPFITELRRDVTLSYIAHALVCGPTSRAEAHLMDKQLKAYPLVINLSKVNNSDSFQNLVCWCSSSKAIVPCDRWLYSLLSIDTCLVFAGDGFDCPPKNNFQDVFTFLQSQENIAILFLNASYCGGRLGVQGSFAGFFEKLAKSGFQFRCLST